MLRWLKTNQPLLANAEKAQQKYIAATNSLEEDAKNLKIILQKMPAANGDWITNLLIRILWIIVFLGILVYLFQSPGVLRILSAFLSLFRSFKGFGLELNFAEKSGANEEIHMAFQRIFTELRLQVKTHVHLFSQRKNLQKALGKISKEVTDDINRIRNDSRDIDFRCTIHVPDMLFNQFLCQIVDYEPKGEGMGRSWSIFYGIIGRTWRSEKEEVLHLNPELPDQENMLQCVREYGMTQDQVRAAAKGRKSFMCIPIKDSDGNMLGVFYMDASDSNAFGIKVENEYNRKIEKNILDATSSRLQRIEKLLTNYREDCLGKAPLIQIIGA